MTKFKRGHWLSFLVPAGLLLGAYGSQYIGGLVPCEMCWWQRWPHFAAVPLAGLAFVISNPGLKRVLVALAAFAILTSGAIGGYHAGVEYGWWEGLSKCSGVPTGSGADVMRQILEAPTIRCDVSPWTLFGISLAGFNFLLSTGAAIAILGLIARDKSA
ncbi:MAG: disulfide bond formation protein B [Sphingorhabdus sp.]